MGPGGLERFLQDHWKIDDHFRDAVTLPLTSAPATLRNPGGISLAGAATGVDARRLGGYLDVWERLIPPELHRHQAPVILRKGRWLTVADGVEMHFADRPPRSHDRTYSFIAESSRLLEPHLNLRRTAPGELSFQSVLRIPETNRRQAFLDLLSDSSRLDLTLATGFKDLLDTDQELHTLARNIDGRVHGEIAARHLQRPILGKTEDLVLRHAQGLSRDLDNVLQETIPHDEIRERRVRYMTRHALPSMERLAFAYARSDHRANVEEDHLRHAAVTYATNLDRLLRVREVQDLHVKLARVSKTDRGILILELLLEEPRQDVAALWERAHASGSFKDRTDLQAALDRMRDNGDVWVDSQGRYSTV